MTKEANRPMRLLDKHGPYVKDQIITQHKLAEKFRDQDWRVERHIQNANQARLLLDDLAMADEQIKNAGSEESKSLVSAGVAMLPEDLDGLPRELLDQLVISESDALECEIINLLRHAGGTLPINKIIIGLFRKTGNIQQRAALISKLHRMASKKRIYSASDRSGIFSLNPLDDDTLRNLVAESSTEASLDVANSSIEPSNTPVLDKISAMYRSPEDHMESLDRLRRVARRDPPKSSAT